jgi:dTDP-4-amino-4,6-dideoxygalactose transaminase
MTTLEKPAILGGIPLRSAGPPDWPAFDPEVDEAIRRALSSGAWGKYHGPNLPELIELLAAFHGVPHVLPCASGTAAVELALRGIPVGPGDEVILAAYDFKGNMGDVLAVGAFPVLVDISADNWNLDPEQLSAALSPRTKAILVSHLHGGVVDMERVTAFAREHQLAVIEDAAQMPGARIQGRPAGTWGDVGVLSFGGSKLISAGRGGALFTPRDDLAQRVRLYTQRGNDAYPLSELQAAAVIPQWRKLADRNALRTTAAHWLCSALAQVPGLRPFTNSAADSQPGYYKLGMRYEATGFGGLDRDQFAAAMRAEGIALDPGFRSLHKSHAARRFRPVGSLPEATRADSGILTLHHPVLLEGETGLRQVLAAIDRIRKNAVEIAQSLSGGNA